VLVFLAEPANPRLSRSFKNGCLNRLACNEAVRLPRLGLGNRHQSGIVDSFDEAVTEGVQYRAKGADILRRRHVFLGLWADGGR
jgi:hypothetical protein